MGTLISSNLMAVREVRIRVKALAAEICETLGGDASILSLVDDLLEPRGKISSSVLPSYLLFQVRSSLPRCHSLFLCRFHSFAVCTDIRLSFMPNDNSLLLCVLVNFILLSICVHVLEKFIVFIIKALPKRVAILVIARLPGLPVFIDVVLVFANVLVDVNMTHVDFK